MDAGLTETLHEAMPLAATLGIEGVAVEDGAVTTRMAWAAERCTAGGMLHGGAVMTLADATAATCAYLALPDGAVGTATIEAKTNFMRPVTAGWVTARAELVHVGQSTIVVQADVLDDEGRLVSRTLQTQAVLYGSRSPDGG